ncbi:uncharacterized protein LOC111702073 [Eurytemora carolleeae]|uniref:uncharacterized protein LOC111702073 n=1 Tax=Eurytemora carolleeae TaxID=1294199 RepID=UPI000C77DDAC|nr:uncharacterized protein LOC111702073 [Eurytemora carolleeae]|eukprot:XP_023329404.1 uncharacterized protein LOC111702073 [Eurytemora affinis]
MEILVSDAQIPDSIRPTFSNLADAAIFWEFYYRGLPGYSKTGSSGPETRRTTREVYVTSGTADSTTPWYIPSVSDREYNGSRQPTLQDQEIINMRSTCHLALDNCERDAACRPYLDSVKSRCVDSCNRERCMSAVQEFYRKIPRVHALDIAFCLCKHFTIHVSSAVMNNQFNFQKQNDDQCFRAQSLLHPVCAQTPASWSGREEDLPLCHDLSNSCKSSSGCGSRLLRYEQACAVDAKTKTCAGPYEGCRNAMLDILGTELRTNCGCGGPLDFRKLFDCIGYQRLLWMNPCIVDAQKDYHLRIGNTEGPGPEESWSPQPGPMYTEPPYRPGPMYTEPPYRPPPHPPQTPALPLDTPRPFIPYITTTSTPYKAPPTKRPPQTRPPDPIEVTELTEVVTEIVTTTEMVTQVYTRPPPPTPFGPTIQPTWPQPPTLTTRRVFRRTTPRPFQEQENVGEGGGGGGGGGGGRRPTAKISTSTTTTTTTLPPKYCKVEDLEGSNVKYIREGFEKRFYTEGKEGSNLCSCKKSNGGSQHFCTYLQSFQSLRQVSTSTLDTVG